MIWHMLTEDAEFDVKKMVDGKLAKKSESMSKAAGAGSEAPVEREEPSVEREEPPVEREEPPSMPQKEREPRKGREAVKKTGVARKKRKKVG